MMGKKKYIWYAVVALFVAALCWVCVDRLQNSSARVMSRMNALFLAKNWPGAVNESNHLTGKNSRPLMLCRAVALEQTGRLDLLFITPVEFDATPMDSVADSMLYHLDEVVVVEPNKCGDTCFPGVSRVAYTDTTPDRMRRRVYSALYRKDAVAFVSMVDRLEYAFPDGVPGCVREALAMFLPAGMHHYMRKHNVEPLLYDKVMNLSQLDADLRNSGLSSEQIRKKVESDYRGLYCYYYLYSNNVKVHEYKNEKNPIGGKSTFIR